MDPKESTEISAPSKDDSLGLPTYADLEVEVRLLRWTLSELDQLGFAGFNRRRQARLCAKALEATA